MRQSRQSTRRRRGCWGCVLHHPLTVLLTLVSGFWWCMEALPVGITVLVGKTPDLTLLILASCAIGAAQLGPRLVAAGVRGVQRRYAERLEYEYAAEFDDESTPSSPGTRPGA